MPQILPKPDPNDEQALIALLSQPLKPQTPQQVLDLLRNAPPETPKMRAATPWERFIGPDRDVKSGTSPISPAGAERLIAMRDKSKPPPGPTAMRAPTTGEKVKGALASGYQTMADQPLGQLSDKVGMTGFGEMAKQLRGDEPPPEVTLGIMSDAPGKGMAGTALAKGESAAAKGAETAASHVDDLTSARQALMHEGFAPDAPPAPALSKPPATVANLAREPRPFNQLMNELLKDPEAVAGGRRLEKSLQEINQRRIPAPPRAAPVSAAPEADAVAKLIKPAAARSKQIGERVAALSGREDVENARLGDLMKYMLGWEGPQAKKISTPLHSLMERAPVETIGDRFVMSNRIPSAVKAPIQPEGRALVSGLDEVLQSPALTQKFATKARESMFLTESQKALSDRGVIEAYVEGLQRNNEFLLDKFSDFVPRSRKWYDGAHRISNDFAQEFGYHPNQTSGVMAVLSPQKDWHQNVEMARRVIRNQRMFADKDMPFSREMGDQYLRSQLETAEETLRTAQKQGMTNVVANQFRGLVGQMSQRRTGRMLNRPWSALSNSDRAVMMRSFDELQHSTLGKRYPTITPEGDILHPVTMTSKGKEADMVWQSYKEIAKAISILDDPSAENISKNLGQAHKVRAFYNNINEPNYGRQLGQRGSSTVDTHAVAAGHLQPMGTKSPEVEYAMGGAGDAMVGIQGNNPLYQEAIARSGQSRGLLPREAQSPEWEALKGLFDPAKKRNKDFKGNILDLWREYNQGRRSLEGTQDAIFNEAGGIPTPEWARPK